jgi:hypothetical protein
VFLLDTALDAVLEAVVAGIVDVGSCAVAVERRGSGCELRGWGLRWRAVGRLGSECRRTRGARGRFEAGNAVVWVLESTRSVVSAFFVKVGLSSFGGSV